jgi:hypothetical protein
MAQDYSMFGIFIIVALIIISLLFVISISNSRNVNTELYNVNNFGGAAIEAPYSISYDIETATFNVEDGAPINFKISS